MADEGGGAAGYTRTKTPQFESAGKLGRLLRGYDLPEDGIFLQEVPSDAVKMKAEDAWHNGSLRWLQGDYKEARPLLKESVLSRPLAGRVFFLGLAHAACGEQREACKCFLEAALRDPRLEIAYINFEVAFCSNGAKGMMEIMRELAQRAAAERCWWVTGWQRPFGFMRSVHSQPWYEAEDFAFVRQLEERAVDVLMELLALMRSRSGKYDVDQAGADWQEVGKMSPQEKILLENGNWHELHFLCTSGSEEDQRRMEENCRRCPVTAEILRGESAVHHMATHMGGECTFSALGPKAHLKPHCGSTNARLTCHLGLLCPSGCEIRVGTETRPFVEGKCLVFDDSYEHEVWNPTDQVRVVLLTRFWHPDIASDEARSAAMASLREHHEEEQSQGNPHFWTERESFRRMAGQDPEWMETLHGYTGEFER